MKVVLDTNVLLISLKKSSKFRPIFDKLVQGKYHLTLTNEILLEYIEVIGKKANKEIAGNLGNLLMKLQILKRLM